MAQAMVQRVVWNTQGWRRPSGATTDGGYADRTGFGHEEWNFQTDDQLNGELLGYMYYKPTDQVIARSGNSFDIEFFTIDAHSKSRWLVGTWRGARFASSKEIAAFDRHFEREDIYERRAIELSNAVPAIALDKAREEVRRSVTSEWHSFIVLASDVRSFTREEWVELPDKVGSKNVGLYFTRPTFVDKLPNNGEPATIHSIGKKGLARTKQRSPLVEDGYLREVGGALHYIEREHANLSNRLVTWLARQRCRAIRQEERQVDVGFERNGTSYLAEVKVCGSLSTRHAIREAMGQLLEYNHYGWRETADCWWIILDREPSQDDRGYIERLRKTYGLNLRLGWPHGETFSFDVVAFLKAEF